MSGLLKWLFAEKYSLPEAITKQSKTKMSFSPDFKECFQPDTIGDEFGIFGGTRTFDNAVKLCSDSGSTLARISSREEYDLVKKLLENLSSNIPPTSETAGVWLGIHDPEDVTGPGNTGFSFVDGFQNTSFFAEAGKFPWANGEPNDITQNNDNQNSNCVSWRLDKDLRDLWGDDVCALQRLFLCRKKGSCLIVPPTSAPTPSPTTAPTFAPTRRLDIESLSTFQTILLTLIVGSSLGILILLGILTHLVRKKNINERKIEADRGNSSRGDTFYQYI